MLRVISGRSRKRPPSNGKESRVSSPPALPRRPVGESSDQEHARRSARRVRHRVQKLRHRKVVRQRPQHRRVVLGILRHRHRLPAFLRPRETVREYQRVQILEGLLRRRSFPHQTLHRRLRPRPRLQQIILRRRRLQVRLVLPPRHQLRLPLRLQRVFRQAVLQSLKSILFRAPLRLCRRSLRLTIPSRGTCSRSPMSMGTALTIPSRSIEIPVRSTCFSSGRSSLEIRTRT